MPTTRLPAALTLAATLLVAGCGSTTSGASGAPSSASSSPATSSPASTSSPSSSTPSAVPAQGDVVGVGTVLEKGSEGAMVCFGVLDSLPPQCSGPRLIGWDWASAPASEQRDGVRWGEYAVTGTWDGRALTLTTPAVTRAAYEQKHPTPRPGNAFPTPCAEPAGGWAVVDPAATTAVTQTEAITVAQGLPGFGALWVDSSRNPAAADPNAEGDGANNPKKLILNVRVTQDRDAAEAALRKVWGGMLCVTEGGRTETDLLDTQAALAQTPGLVSSSVDGVTSVIDLQVLFDDGSLQRRMDQTYGPGFVRVTSALLPAS
jgi:hypothetical protein